MFYLKASYYIQKNGLDKKDFTDEELQELEDRLTDDKKIENLIFIIFIIILTQDVFNMSTSIIAAGAMFSFLFWLFIIAIVIKVINSAFKETEQHEPEKQVRKMIDDNRKKQK